MKYLVSVQGKITITILKRILFLLLLLPCFAFSQKLDTPGLRISLLTCTPGEELYSTFGHSALRVIDSSRDFDIVFNYGTFRFDQPGFYWKFIRGKLLYFVSVENFANFAYGYRMENRAITEQVLHLSPSEKKKIADYLTWNIQPGNRFYKYDFTFDNCTTRLLELVRKTSDTTIHFNDFLKEPRSFRVAIHKYLNRNEKNWSKLGIDLLLGSRLDREMTLLESMFLPDNLMHGLDSAVSSGVPLVKEKEVIVTRHLNSEKNNNLTSPFFLFFCLFILVSLLSFSRNQRLRNVLASFDRALFFLVGLLGVILVFMWWGTDHYMTKDNYNLLWAWPSHIVAAFYLHTGKKWAAIYFTIYMWGTILLIMAWLFLPQELNPALIPILGILIVRTILFLIKRKSTYGYNNIPG